MEDRCGSGDENDPDEGDNASDLFNAGEGLAQQEIATVSCDGRREEGYDGCVGQREI